MAGLEQGALTPERRGAELVDPDSRQKVLIALAVVSSPFALSLNELAGKRSEDEDRPLVWLNRSVEENLPESAPEESPNLLDVSPLPSCDAAGQRDSPVDPLAIEPARDSKSAAPEDEAAPALSSKLAPVELAPHVDPPPRSTLLTAAPMLVPIELLPDPILAVVVAYSPIVCASACGANSANTAISAPGTINLISLMAFDLP
jgi:hypothetical protein